MRMDPSNFPFDAQILDIEIKPLSVDMGFFEVCLPSMHCCSFYFLSQPTSQSATIFSFSRLFFCFFTRKSALFKGKLFNFQVKSQNNQKNREDTFAGNLRWYNLVFAMNDLFFSVYLQVTPQFLHPTRWRRNAGHTLVSNADWSADFELCGINGVRTAASTYKVNLSFFERRIEGKLGF